MLRLSLILAWSLCGDDTEVASLIESLGDDRYTVRIEAQAQLERLLRSAQGHRFRDAVEAATHHADLEIARRAAAALEAFYDVRPSDYPVMPWIDMLPVNQPERQSTIDGCLRKVRPPGTWGYGSDWPEYRQATVQWTRQLLQEGYPRHCVRQLLDEMVQQERHYREKHGMRDLAARD
jgi:hypothetical protein